MKLPGQKSDKAPDDKGEEKTPAEDAQAKIEELTTQLTASTEARKAEVEAKKVEEEKKKVDAEKDAAEELKAQADLKALLGESEEEAPAEKGNKINDLDNSQLMDVLATAVESCVDARIKQSQGQVDEKVKGITDSVTKVCQLLGNMQTTAALKQVRHDHPDFDTFKEDTLAALKKYPMMEIEDAFLLAKQSRTGGAPPVEETVSERPEITPYGAFGGREEKPTEDREKKPPTEKTPVSGIVGFRDIVSRAVDKLDIGKGR